MVEGEGQLRVGVAHGVRTVDSGGAIGSDAVASAVVKTTDSAEELCGLIVRESSVGDT